MPDKGNDTGQSELLLDESQVIRFQTTVHGFHPSFRDWASEHTSVPHAVAEVALAHQAGSAVERAYARSGVFDKRRGLMDPWVEYVTKEAAGHSCDGRWVAGQSAPPRPAPPGPQAQQRRLAARVRRASLLRLARLGFFPRREAQYFRIRSATAWRCSAVIVRLRLPAALTAFFLPRRTTGPALPSIASMARCWRRAGS